MSASFLSKLEAFKGIPGPFDLIQYEQVYYDEVKALVLEHFGENATLLDATRAMNMIGNVSFFEKFPDIYNHTKEDLKYLYNPTFEILKNEFTDYTHGLSHIRAKASHTSLGESLLKADQFFFTGLKYNRIINIGRQIDINESTLTLNELSTFSTIPLPRLLMVRMELKRIGIRKRVPFTAYQPMYKKGLFQKDYPIAKDLSHLFYKNPTHQFEFRLAYNLVRAMYMDKKYEMYSSTMTPYSLAPIKTSKNESYTLAFCNQEEEFWISKIFDSYIFQEHHMALKQIVNSVFNKSSEAKKIAALVIKELLATK